MSIKLNSSGGGSVTLQEPSTATTGTLSLPAGSGTVAVNGLSSNIVSGTVQASTSGSAITFTGIPSWAKRVTVMLQGVSGSATAILYMQIGSGSLVATGYLGNATYLPLNTATNANTYWPLEAGNGLGAAALRHGSFVLVNITGNTWVMSGMQANSNDSGASVAAGSLALSGALDRVSIALTAGTFDAGNINILYE